MITHDLTQGSPEWHAYRADHFNASDAPAMMGCSPYKTRAELLRELHTGLAADVDAATQRRFDDGHRSEALARPLAEKIIGSDLYPVVGSEGRLSASFDGITMGEDVLFEHKRMNADIRAAFDAMDRMGPHDDTAACRLLPIYHRVQMEQQLHVSGAERVLFMASEWTADDELIDQRHVWYYPDAELRAAIIAGWDQFARDLAAYVPPAAAEPAPVGRAPETLPALRIEVTGAVTASNLAEFKATALAAIQSVNRSLKTDQDFADAAKAVKWCEDIESRIKAAKEHALSQTESIDALFKALDDITGEAKRVRLDLSKLVDRRKTEVKEEAVAAARRALDAHIADLNGELAPMRLQPVAADFAGAIKGLRSIASMQDALDTTLANAKIAADGQARVIRGNVAAFKAKADGLEFLFSDLGQIVHKAADDFATLVDARIAKHRADEAAREAQRQADAERAAAEKLMAAAYEAATARAGHDAPYEVFLRFAGGHGAKVPAEKVSEYISALSELQATPAPVPVPASATNAEKIETARRIVDQVIASGNAAEVRADLQVLHDAAVQVASEATAANEPATLNLGAINTLLAADGGLVLRGEFVTNVLKVPAASRSPRGVALWRESQLSQIVIALHNHLSRVLAQKKAA